jgi:hypothetical protein
MPDPIVMAQATGLALVIAALSLAALAWWGRRRPSGPAWADVGWVVGVGAGYYLGCWMLEIRPRWPIREDLDRLLGLIIPAVLLVELLAAIPRLPRWPIWALRIAVAGLGGRVLLHGSMYLSGPAGPGSSAWTAPQAWLILGSIAAAEVATWVLLGMLARRPAGASLPIALAFTVGGASMTVMLSAYLSGGQAGLPLSAALLGAGVAALFWPDASRSVAPIGVAVVGLSSLLVIGRFFGELRTDHAVLLLAAPLLAWVPELPRLRRLRPWIRGLLRVGLVGLVVSGVLADAARRFIGNTGPAAEVSGSKEPTLEDYMNLGP